MRELQRFTAWLEPYFHFQPFTCKGGCSDPVQGVRRHSSDLIRSVFFSKVNVFFIKEWELESSYFSETINHSDQNVPGGPMAADRMTACAGALSNCYYAILFACISCWLGVAQDKFERTKTM